MEFIYQYPSVTHIYPVTHIITISDVKGNHHQFDYLFKSLLRLPTNNTLKFHITAPLWGDFSSQRPIDG